MHESQMLGPLLHYLHSGSQGKHTFDLSGYVPIGQTLLHIDWYKYRG